MSTKSPLRPSITPRTFTRMQEFHCGLQKLASAPQYAFIYKFNKTFGSTTPYLEKGLQPVLEHTGWNVTTGFINLIFYVAADKSEPRKRIMHSDENRRRFATLKQYSSQIELEFGAKLLWLEDISRSGMYQASVMVDPASMEIATNSNDKRWPAIQSAVLETAKRLNDVLLKYLPYIDNPTLLAAKLKSSSATKPVSNTPQRLPPKAIEPPETIAMPVSEDLKVIVGRAANRSNFPGAESDAHKNLKNFIATNPAFLGLPATSPKGQTEYDLPSGDTVDVLFQCSKDWIAVEIKSHKSPDCDITRGLFQCVKYQAVIKAYCASLSKPINVRTVLVVGKPFPKSLIPLRNLLGIEVRIHPSI